MSFTDRILSGLKTVILIEERVTTLSETVHALKSLTEQKLTDHDRRLTRLETIIDLTRPNNTPLHLAPP